jgi:hypothetical protein
MDDEEVIVIGLIPATTHVMWMPDGSFIIVHRANSQLVTYASAGERIAAARGIVNGLLDDLPWIEQLAAREWDEDSACVPLTMAPPPR